MPTTSQLPGEGTSDLSSDGMESSVAESCLVKQYSDHSDFMQCPALGPPTRPPQQRPLALQLRVRHVPALGHRPDREVAEESHHQ